MFEIRTVESLEPLRILQQAAEAAVAMPPLDQWLLPDHIGLWVATAEGPAGAVLLVPCRRSGNRVAKYQLGWIYVLPSFRRTGLGIKLMAAAAEQAASRGASAIEITLSPDFQHLLSWFTALPSVPGVGFVVTLARRPAMAGV